MQILLSPTLAFDAAHQVYFMSYSIDVEDSSIVS